MKILVAGATGVIGNSLVPLLNAVGHEVVGLSRSPHERAGAQNVVADALDAAAVAQAVRAAQPDVIVNLLTAIPARINARNMTRDFALTNRLRVEGTRNLIAAAPGVRILSQSVAYLYDPAPGLANEDAPLWNDVPRRWATSFAALVELDRQTTAAGGLTLRFGHLYGPGSAFAPQGSITQDVRTAKMPVVGKRSATWSFTHADDAASAIVAAVDRDVAGALNIVDDTPVPVAEFLPAYARSLGAPKPKHVPEFLAKLAVGDWGVAYMCRLRGADNSRARLALNWRPRYASWRDGMGLA